MKKTVSAFAAAVVLALGATVAIAQSANYSGPSTAPKAVAAGAYSGPSVVPLMTVKQLIDTGRDDQHARLQGRIVSHNGGEHYSFEDATGRITVEIDHDKFPAGQTISAESRVELLGEFDKGLRKTEFEVERMALMP
ncbi:YgiW/YdeI family stress tolerance OB fold protein [Ottowia thiooxydans]|uniref:YgiW/YdeI family stress tolerance OB fold protein n=1 Tax=Ottowia thiooxydans TaxID=219182 RepID=UPI00041F81F7|nr:NirD/YgiW/YdeI family stress tolerance protein [Ottowia thiooxydans]